MALKRAFQELQASLNSQADKSALPYATNPRLEDGTVTFQVVHSTQVTTRVQVVILNEEEYPNSAVCIYIEDGSPSEALQEQLVQLQERQFHSNATLPDVLDKVLAVFRRQSAGHEGRDVVMARARSASGSELMEVDVEEQQQGAASNMDHDGASQDGGSEAYNEEDSDGGGYGSDDGEEEDEEERAMLTECGKRQGRWERFEAALAEAEAQQEKGLSAEQMAAKKQQIFDPREAFLMLSKELLDIYKQQSYTMFVDTIDDDVYHWAVELSSFAPGSGLEADMGELRRKHGYSSVKLTLKFMRRLHPFYPASVAIVRPHFQHWAHGAVASHPMLQLGAWDPLRPQLQFIEQLKTFLEANVRVDLDSELNNLQSFPHACYRPVEQYLARLEALAGMQPLCVMDVDKGWPAARELYERRGGGGASGSGTGAGSDEGGANGRKKRGRSSGAGEAEEKECAASAATAAAAAATTAGPAGAAPSDKVKPAEQTFWARGTGYGHGNKAGEVWDNTASIAMQKARDLELMSVMLALARSVLHEMGPLQPFTAQSPALTAAAETAGGSSEQRVTRSRSAARQAAASDAADTAAAGNTSQPSNTSEAGPAAARGDGAFGAAVSELTQQVGGLDDEAAIAADKAAAEENAGYPPDSSACLTAVSASCLVPFLVRELRMASFSDMCARQAYYSAVMRLLVQLARPQCTALLCTPLPAHVEGGVTLAACITQLLTPARQYIQLTRAALVAKMSEQASLQEQLACGPSVAVQAQLKALAESLAELKASMRLALLANQAATACEAVMSSHSAATRQHPTAAAGGGSRAGGAAGTSGVRRGAASAGTDADYCKEMKPLQVQLMGLSNHKFANLPSGESVQPSERVVRLGREIAGLNSDLALSTSSSVFVRVDEQQMSLWRALITGPDDTPYSGGCFIFDFYFPPSYPQVCPQVNLRTTGGGTVRFNPNLYNCGKVCLSLLGTWAGGKGEGWLPGVSTANQVLLSIQSLIFVEHPYFNEPGYEKSIGTSQGSLASRQYNEVIREATIRYAMLDLLKHPPAEFTDVITAHFRLRSATVLKVVDGWVSDAGNSRTHTSNLTSLRSSLAAELAKL